MADTLGSNKKNSDTIMTSYNNVINVKIIPFFIHAFCRVSAHRILSVLDGLFMDRFYFFFTSVTKISARMLGIFLNNFRDIFSRFKNELNTKKRLFPTHPILNIRVLFKI